MIVYADTSALAKLLVLEPGTVEMQATMEGAEVVAAAAIAYVELRAALAAARRDGRLPGTPADDVARVETIWQAVSEIVSDSALIRAAGDLAERQRLRAYDAVHLAALTVLGAPGDITFACWNADLRHAASELGYPLLPA